jgi:hypothetical protein
MPIGLGVSLGVGGGKPSTSGGAPGGGGGGFSIGVRDTRANIVARTGDPVGTIAFVTSGPNEYDLMVYDGTNWQIYFNS